MRTRMFVVGIVGVLALGGSTLAFGAGAQQKVAASARVDSVQPLPHSLAKAQKAVGELAQSRIHCRTLHCINSALSQVSVAFDVLGQCLAPVDVAQYSGYRYSNDGGATQFQTTGLDWAQPGDASTKVMTLVC
jgi:hypothetical protein